MMRILIVDDLYDARQVLRYMVENNGHEAIEAENGAEALTIAKSTPPDLIVSDGLMPVMDGFKFLRAVKQEPELCAIPFVFYSSSYKEDQDVRLAMSLGANAYLFKPMDPVELWEEIEDILEKAKLNVQNPTEHIKEDADYLRRYSEVVATKLEEKVSELEKTLAERNLALATLRERDAFMTTLLNAIPIPVFYKDRAGSYQGFNKAFEEFFGATREQLIGKTVFDINSPELAAIYYAKDNELFENGRRQQYDSQVKNLHGLLRDVIFTKAVFTDSQGAVSGLIGTILDITERKRAEQRLYESKATLTTVFDGMSEPLIVLDAGLQVKRINKAAKDYYNLTSYQEASGKFCYEAFKGRTSSCDGCERCFSTLDGFTGSYERRGEMDRNRLEQVFVDIVRDEVGAPTAYIIRISDITQARMIDRQLLQSEKLASLGLLMAGIAHEINNPNNFIYFNAPIMRSYFHFLLPIADEYAAQHSDLKVFGRSYPAFREDCFELLDNIEYGSTRINQIVGNLREFVRERGQGEIRPIDLKQVVEKAISICLGRIKKQVKTFEKILPEGPLNLSTDPLAIEQVLVNLLVNAIQAMDKKDSLLRLTITRPDTSVGNVVVEVSDNGCGMDAEIRKKIFDPFFTTKAVGIGTGLGLSISLRLVTELGGRIEVESEPGIGSIFRVVLPMKSL